MGMSEYIVIIGFLLLVLFLFQNGSPFPERWFPSQLANWAFTVLFCIWILAEIVNNIYSSKNSDSQSQDRGSHRLLVAAIYIAIFAVFILREFGFGVFSSDFQYFGLMLLALGILVREWAIFVLGRHFTVRVQVRKKARLVTEGPYRFIRHPSYTGSMASYLGLSLAIGSLAGAILVLVLCGISHEYRMRVEEEALLKAFGSKYEAYKKRTWKLFPGY